jgi:ribosome biogenesis protein ENP2
VTALQRDGDLSVVAGSSEGTLKLYDLRFPTPYMTKQHPYMVPINEIVFHNKAEKMIVSDEKSIRVYDKQTGNLFTAIESKFKINGVKTYQDSGLLLIPQEARRIGKLA